MNILLITILLFTGATFAIRRVGFFKSVAGIGKAILVSIIYIGFLGFLTKSLTKNIYSS